MATYDELFEVFGNGPLRNRVTIACIQAAETIRAELPTTENHAARLVWARAAFTNPGAVAIPMLWIALIQNKTKSVAQILAASDTLIQTAVDSAVDVMTV